MLRQLSHTCDSCALTQVLQEVLDTNRRPGPFESSAFICWLSEVTEAKVWSRGCRGFVGSHCFPGCAAKVINDSLNVLSVLEERVNVFKQNVQ